MEAKEFEERIQAAWEALDPLRERRGAQAWFADRAGYSYVSVSRWCRGKVPVLPAAVKHLETLEALATTYKDMDTLNARNGAEEE